MAISIPYAVASAEGLSAEHRETVLELLNNWQSHYSGNVVRSQYCEARNMLKDLGIAVPDSLQGATTCRSTGSRPPGTATRRSS